MTRQGEKGAISKPWGSVIPVALVYPNSYRLGMGNLGFQFLYDQFNSDPRFSAERFFIPEAGSRGKQACIDLLSEESARPLANFRVIAFSVPFENDYPRVPGSLISAGIPPLSADRGPHHPLVIAGGVSVSMNPEPLAPFLDLAFIGEVEKDSGPSDFLSTLADAVQIPGTPTSNRSLLLNKFQGVPGVYVPSAYTFSFAQDGLIREIHAKSGFPDHVKAVKRRSKKAAVPVSVLFSPEAEFGDSLLVEINRGCGRGCRFCAAGWIHFPVRHTPFGTFREKIAQSVREGRTVGLIGSDLASHPELEEILAFIVGSGGKFSLSSIRPEGINPGIIRLIAKTGQKTATLAPETASARMKKVIGKQIPSERFYELIDLLVAAGVPHIRFYFMVGLPTETDDDAQAIVDFALNSRKVFLDASRRLKRIGRISIQLNPFIPKPWTPFQWAAMEFPHIIEHRLKIVRNGLKKTPNLVVRTESVRQAIFQAFLSRGDRRIASTLLSIALGEMSWNEVCKKGSRESDFYIHRERLPNEIFPWEVTDHGVSRETLRRHFVNALSDQNTCR